MRVKENRKSPPWAEFGGGIVDKDLPSRPFFAIEGGAHEDKVLGGYC